jgi:thioredoxin-related protein
MLTISLEEAFAKAKLEDKLVLLYCTAEWCAPCKRMERTVFSLEEVGDLLNPKFVFVKRDMEKGEGPELRERFNVRGYPAYIIFDKDGTILYRFSGGTFPAERFILTLAPFFDQSLVYENMAERYAAGERDAQLIRYYAASLRYEKRDSAFYAVIEEAFDRLCDEQRISPEYWFIFEQYAPRGSKYLRYLVENRSRFYETIGEDKVVGMLVSRGTNGYSNILTGVARITKNEMDELAQEIGVFDHPEVILYRALLEARNDGTVDNFLMLFEKNARYVLDMQRFISLCAQGLRGVITAPQKEHFLTLVDDERFVGIIERIVVK